MTQITKRELDARIDAWYNDESSPHCNNASLHAGYWLGDSIQDSIKDMFNDTPIATYEDFDKARARVEMEIAIWDIENASAQVELFGKTAVLGDVASTWCRNIRRMQYFQNNIDAEVIDTIGPNFYSLADSVKYCPLLRDDSGPMSHDPEYTVAGQDRFNRAWDMLGHQGEFILGEIRKELLTYEGAIDGFDVASIYEDFEKAGAHEIMHYYSSDMVDFKHSRQPFSDLSENSMKSAVEAYGSRKMYELVKDNWDCIENIEGNARSTMSPEIVDQYIGFEVHTEAWGDDVPFDEDAKTMIITDGEVRQRNYKEIDIEASEKKERNTLLEKMQNAWDGATARLKEEGLDQNNGYGEEKLKAMRQVIPELLSAQKSGYGNEKHPWTMLKSHTVIVSGDTKDIPKLDSSIYETIKEYYADFEIDKIKNDSYTAEQNEQLRHERNVYCHMFESVVLGEMGAPGGFSAAESQFNESLRTGKLENTLASVHQANVDFIGIHVKACEPYNIPGRGVTPEFLLNRFTTEGTKNDIMAIYVGEHIAQRDAKAAHKDAQNIPRINDWSELADRTSDIKDRKGSDAQRVDSENKFKESLKQHIEDAKTEDDLEF